MINKEEFIQFMTEGGKLIEDMVLHRLSLQKMPRSTYYYHVRKYQKAGLIKPKERKKYGNTFILTDKGRSLIKKPTVRKKRNDGFSTIIMFDIPEERKNARTIFRRYLIRNGYVLIQKSALISPLEVSQELKDLIDELKIKSNVKIISGKILYF